MKSLSLVALFIITSTIAYSQHGSVKGRVTSNSVAISHISIQLSNTRYGTLTNEQGFYELANIPAGNHNIIFSGVGYTRQQLQVEVKADNTTSLNVQLKENPSNLNEVVVTGASRATEVRKSPIPVAVMTKKMMDQNVNNNLIDAIVKGVPGVSAVTTGPNVSKPFIRGLGYNRVLTLYDGLRQEGQQWGDEHGIEIDQYGVARAEVVKGPASLTYGSDALAGVINMIPAVPAYDNHKLSGDATVDYHTNNGMVGTSLGLGYRANDWKYTFRGTAKQAYSYSNKIDGTVYGTAFKEYNLSAAARVDKNWGYSKIAATLYDNRQEIPDGSRDSLSRRFTRQVLDQGDDIKNRPIVPEDELKTYAINPLHQRIQHYRLYSSSEVKLGGGNIDVLLGAQQSIRREYNHPTLPQQAGLYVILNTFSYDVKYNLPTLAGFENTVGIGGMYQSNRSKNGTDFPIPDYNLFDVGGYFFTKRSVGKLDISGGLRLDNRSIHWNDFFVGTNPLTGFGQHITNGNTTGAYLQFPRFDHYYQGFSGSLGLTYNLTEKLLIKANIARGYRAPNITEIGSNGLDPGAHIVYLGNRNFKPEFNTQLDLGLMAWLQNLDLSIELFNNQIQNYIYQARVTDASGNPVVIVPGNLTYQYQQSKARLYGAEVSLNIHPEGIKWLIFNNSLACTQGLNKNTGLIVKYGDAAKYLPFIPPLHIRSGVKLTAQNNYHCLSKPYFKFDADINAAQNHFYALDNTESYTAGYTLINAGIGITIQRKSGKSICDIFLQVDNLFDVTYQSNLNRLKYFEYYAASPNGRMGIYNMGRNVSLKIIVPF
ncbi:TonB-dependent receptor [Mucilaginibacter agri]|uniref:TonB-dependent receptor n=1 Tax=Mucilaginibacter agri TaxID=2695265 RepID=A0A966DR54_9SPHI|nr:TonB-dependent receptor [Mucilaginibacter agri]NCD68678.1 TonB-dependent receptor [Mucilaginibacter agri]